VKRLKEIKTKKIKDIRSKGLLIGVEFVLKPGETVRPICEKLMDKGVLAKDTHEKTIRFAPPLVITRGEVDWAIERIREIFEKYEVTSHLRLWYTSEDGCMEIARKDFFVLIRLEHGEDILESIKETIKEERSTMVIVSGLG